MGGLESPAYPYLQTVSVHWEKTKQIFINLKIKKYEKQIFINDNCNLIIAISSVAQEKGTFTDSRDGKKYKTVKIGTQTWMAENLAFKADSGCWAYDNNQNNVATYGYLYDAETAIIACPSGWHLPSDAELTTLINYLGGEDVAGYKLKETGTSHWKSTEKEIFPTRAVMTNESGFTALPGGSRTYYGYFRELGTTGIWWSSTEHATMNGKY